MEPMKLPDRSMRRVHGGELEKAGVKVYDDLSKRGEPVFDAKDVNIMLTKSINEGNFFRHRTKNMTKDLNAATESIDQALVFFNEKLNQFIQTEDRFVKAAKKQSGDLRDAVQKLGDGLQRIEKTANFDKLERMVLLIERAADAMERLDSLQQAGKLDKILAAIK